MPKAARTQQRKGVPVVKTTIELPAALWERAKLRAVKERTDLRSLVISALEAHLKRRHK